MLVGRCRLLHAPAQHTLCLFSAHQQLQQLGEHLSSMAISTVVVTGASGYIGSELVKQLLEKGYNVRAVTPYQLRTCMPHIMQMLTQPLRAPWSRSNLWV